MVDNKTEIDIYKIDTKAKLDKRKIFFAILIVVAIICASLTQMYIVRTINEYKAYKQYEFQLQALEHQEKEKQAEQEKLAEQKEKEKRERIPKLTDVRKAKYGKYL